MDLQDVFQRLTFDTTCVLITGYDPGCLSVDLPDVPFSKAMDDAEEAIFMRNVLPERVWKLKRWLGIGSERKLAEARVVLDEVIGGYITMKRDELGRREGSVFDRVMEEGADLLTSYIGVLGQDDNKFLRDTILNLMIAGRDANEANQLEVNISVFNSIC